MKKITIILTSILIGSLLLVSNIKTLSADNLEDGILSTYTQDFSDINEVNQDFQAYYQFEMGIESTLMSIGTSATQNTRFYIENNTLIRQSLNEDISTNYDTQSFAIMTLMNKRYTNFELTVDYKMGSQTYYWPVVGIRQNQAGRYFCEDGAGIFLQRQGYVTIWGRGFGPWESDPVESYAANEWHTMKLRVEGNLCSVYIDGETSPSYAKNLPSSLFTSGYISLMSINNDSQFRNLRIDELEITDSGNGLAQLPVEDADTPDSILNQAEEVDQIVEVPKQDTQAPVVPTNEPEVIEILGPVLIGVFVLGAATLFLIPILKKKRDK